MSAWIHDERVSMDFEKIVRNIEADHKLMEAKIKNDGVYFLWDYLIPEDYQEGDWLIVDNAWYKIKKSKSLVE